MKALATVRSLVSMKVAVLAVTATSAALALAACTGASVGKNLTSEVGSSTALAASTSASAKPTLDIVQTAVNAGTFTVLASALQEADLVKTLQGPGPFTVFAPTDAAFAKIPSATLEALFSNKAALQNVLLQHVAAGSFEADRIFLRNAVKTLVGLVACNAGNCAPAGVLSLVPYAHGRVGGAVTVVKEDIKATNGVIHVIDTVLLTPAGR